MRGSVIFILILLAIMRWANDKQSETTHGHVYYEKEYPPNPQVYTEKLIDTTMKWGVPKEFDDDSLERMYDPNYPGYDPNNLNHMGDDEWSGYFQ